MKTLHEKLMSLPTEALLIIIILFMASSAGLYVLKLNTVVQSEKKISIEKIDNSAVFKTHEESIVSIVEERKPEEPLQESKNTGKTRLFYIQLDNEGRIILKSVIKTIELGTTPLTRTIQELLKGPSAAEINRGILSLIPEETELLSVSVREGTAYLNFNESFRFNALGIEGYSAQIRQLVYTATDFETVERVQFLINGNIEPYLGPEGVFIGKPISQKDLEL